MAGLLATLGGNPFNTPVGQKIEQATDASLQAENWALNMEICDIINETDEGPKDAIRALRKRLQQNMGKNYTVVLYTLTVLETCVKNCGRRFHLLVTQKDFVLDLVKLIGPKNDPPLAIQDRVLSLIQSWADAFHNNPEMQGVVHVYQDLKLKGIEFPMTDLDTMAPIITPQRSAAAAAVAAAPPPPLSANDQPTQMAEPKHLPARISPSNEAAAQSNTRSAGLQPDQLVKLRSELDVVQGNMKVFGEMLTELSPGQEHPEDLELLLELQKTLSAMQSRIVELIERVGSEEITSELLRINDDLNNLFLRFERYEKKRRAVNAAVEVKPSIPIEPLAAPPEDSVIDKPLIDFGDLNEVNDISSGLQQLDVAEGGDTASVLSKSTVKTTQLAAEVADEFDMFAQSRNISYESSKTRGSSYADNTNLDNLEGALGQFAQSKGQPEFPDGQISSEHPVPNADFEKFLAKRAVAADALPDLTTSNRPAAALQPTQNRRQLEKDDAESALFTL